MDKEFIFEILSLFHQRNENTELIQEQMQNDAIWKKMN